VNPRQPDILLVCVLLAGLTTACDRQEAAGPPEQTTFEVDADGVYYVTVRPDGSLNPTNHLADIPTPERGVVGVHVDDEIPESMARRKLYAADLFGARPGDRVTGELRSFDDFKRVSHAASFGGHRAADTYATTRRILSAAGAQPLPEERDAAREARAAGLAPTPEPAPQSDDGEIVIESLEELKAWTEDE
jgi:hypothetical protein